MNLPLNAPARLHQDPHAAARYHMVEQQIRPWNVLDAAVLERMGQVQRERFVPAEHASQAFMDFEIPLHGTPAQAAAHGWCMLAPRIEARTLQDLALQGSERVLEIGAGSGHMAALLAACAREVVTLEIVPELAHMARHNLQAAGVHNAQVQQADGANAAQLAPLGRFDAIVLSGSVAEVPQHLLALLNEGGHLAAIVGQLPIMRFTLVHKTGTQYTTRQPWDTVAPRLAHFAQPAQFRF